MLWKFGFASGSTLDKLLSRESPPTVEELLDEQDILAECKAQNSKCVDNPLLFIPPSSLARAPCPPSAAHHHASARSPAFCARPALTPDS
jgi:hypothetical protein